MNSESGLAAARARAAKPKARVVPLAGKTPAVAVLLVALKRPARVGLPVAVTPQAAVPAPQVEARPEAVRRPAEVLLAGPMEASDSAI